MNSFRRVQELISQLPEGHYASGLKVSDPIVPEIKRRAREDQQSLPELVEKCLVELRGELGYRISVEFINALEVRRDRWPPPEDFREAVRQHVAAFEDQRSRGECIGEEEPPSILVGPTVLQFHENPEDSGGGIGVGFDQDCAEDLKPWLLGPGEIGRDGRPMVPMAQQAIDKGADYLLCRVSRWDGWHEIVEGCFGRVTWTSTSPRVCLAPKGLRELRGVVLFSRYDDFCVVNDANAGEGSWLAEVPRSFSGPEV